MKTLQNNFTTPDQSKKLLALGVPEDSADCYLVRTNIKGDTFIVEVFHDELYSWKDKYENILEYLPCWSVGRLMEIFEICTGLVWQNEIIEGYTKIDMLLEDFEDVEQKYAFDFSKLEE